MLVVVEQFLLERKQDKIKEKIKPNLEESEKQKILSDLEEKFSLNNWLPDAAKRASQLSMVSHPGKFSHPSAKTSSIIAKRERANDGYLRSGNVEYDLDVFGNAAALDVYKFLNLKIDDGDSILSHLERDSQSVKSIFTISAASYEDLKAGLLSIKQTDNSAQTDRLVKQVYFSVKNSYHLLSILTPSGLASEVKSRIDKIRFSEVAKQARDCRKENKFHEAGFDDLFDLTVIGYGGTKPQNISILNSQNGGKSYLMSSLPPKLEKRDVRLPSNNFFKNSLWVKPFKGDFQFLDKLIHDRKNNYEIRNEITKTINHIADQVLQIVFKIRSLDEGWSGKENYSSLPLAQRIWLDDSYLRQRENESDWLDEIARDFARWIISTYEYLFKEAHEKLGDDEFSHICKLVKEVINEDKESFR